MVPLTKCPVCGATVSLRPRAAGARRLNGHRDRRGLTEAPVSCPASGNTLAEARIAARPGAPR